MGFGRNLINEALENCVYFSQTPSIYILSDRTEKYAVSVKPLKC